MALAWQWILEKLARLPDVPIETLQEVAVYVPNVGEIPSLAKGLALRQLQEMLASEENLDPLAAKELIVALAPPNEDTSGLLMIVDGNSKKELFHFVQRKKACLETPVLDKIADDCSAGLYPPAANGVPSSRTQQEESARGMPPVDEEHEQNDGMPPKSVPQARTPRHLSVGSEDTTVIIDGSTLKSRPSNGEVSCKMDNKRMNEAADKSPAAVSPENNQNAEEITIIHSANVSVRRSKRKMLVEDDDDDNELFVKPKRQSKQLEVEVINIMDSDDDGGENSSQKDAEQSKPVEDGPASSKPPQERNSLENGHDECSDKCYRCHLGGKLIHCDGCAIALHQTCITSNRVSEGEGWFCPSCVYKKAMEKLAKAKEEADQLKGERDRFLSITASKQQEKPLPLRVKVENEDNEGEDKHEDDSDDSSGSDYTKRGNKRRKKMTWSKLEEETLTEGVRLHDTKWTRILKFGMGKFHTSRTGQDLKDKWRNIIKKKHR